MLNMPSPLLTPLASSIFSDVTDPQNFGAFFSG
jgi:hypothetical protein